ncbi:hypothetical protein [Neisseria sp.]|uniref:hypothetical protein n=1 Tax=Neisseria sp. TaxID=192066 RepID=UPI0035A0BFBA
MATTFERLKILEISLDSSQLEHGLSQLKKLRQHPPHDRAIATEKVSLTEDNFENESWGDEKWKQSKCTTDGEPCN